MATDPTPEQLGLARELYLRLDATWRGDTLAEQFQELDIIAIAEALSEAAAEGRREGLREAAELCHRASAPDPRDAVVEAALWRKEVQKHLEKAAREGASSKVMRAHQNRVDLANKEIDDALSRLAPTKGDG